MPKSMTQVKFTIDSSIVSAFRSRCESQEISMTSVIAQFMIGSKPTKAVKSKIDTRPHRKKAVAEYIDLLERLLHMEELYRDAIPEQFEARYEAANHSCGQLEEAISCLDDAY